MKSAMVGKVIPGGNRAAWAQLRRISVGSRSWSLDRRWRLMRALRNQYQSRLLKVLLPK